MKSRFDPPSRCCPICDGESLKPIYAYTKPPTKEVRFAFSSSPDYYREIWRCEGCGHFVSVHQMDMSSLYSGDYVTSNYADDDGLRNAFNELVNLPPEKSDNEGRVKCVVGFAASHFAGRSAKPSILDIGSGLCVFLNRMKTEGWDCTALDPDVRAAAHARDTVGIKAIAGDFMKMGVNGHFDVVALNKVLEHVPDPVVMLVKAVELLLPSGFVYLEVPDGDEAAREGRDREEFAIDHLHVFSPRSVMLLVERAGLRVAVAERVREPSTKVTLRVLATL